MQSTINNTFPQVKLSTSIIFALIYTALMGIGMAYMYSIEGVKYGSAEMVYVVWWIQLIITVFTVVVAIKFFGIGMGLGAFRPRTAESKNIIFLFLIILLTVAVQFVYGTESLGTAEIEGLLYTLLVVSMVGFAEEVMYRGIVFRAIYAKYGPVSAILGSSVVFSLLHTVNVFGGLSVPSMLIQLALTFIAGLGLGYLTYRVNNLLPAIIFHIFWDFLLVGSVHVGVDLPIASIFSPIIFIVVTVGLIKISKANNPKQDSSLQDVSAVEPAGGTKSRLRKLGLIIGVGASGLLALIVVVLLVSSTAKELAKSTIWNSITITEFRVDGNVVYMNKAINSKTYDQFVAILEQNPGIDTLIEENIPGSLDDETMIKLAYLVRERGISTHLLKHSTIDSGGVDLFLAGVNRTMERGAHIGVHSWSDSTGDVQASDIPQDDPRHELNRKYIEEMLGDDAFYWFTIYAAPADSIYEMTEQEIINYGLITEPIINNQESTRMSGVLARKIEVIGNPKARDVYIYAQGGPVTKFKVDEAYFLLIKEGGLKIDDTMLVSVQQAQTLHPWEFTFRDISFQEAINYDVETTRFMAAAIQFYKSRGHRVYVVGTSFGAFVVQDVIASYGNIADGYIILAGRLDMEEASWQEFSEGRFVVFQDGNIIPADNTAAGMGGDGEILNRNVARLAAGLGYRRYTELLIDIPLQNLVYGFGTLDEQVGPLTKAEIDYLLAKNVTVLSLKAGHSNAIISLIEKAVKALQAKQAVLSN